MASLRNVHHLRREVFKHIYGSESVTHRINLSQNIRDLHRQGGHVKQEWGMSGFCNRLTDRLSALAGIFTRHCNAIAAQRLRRAIQIITHYNKLGYDRDTIIKNLVEKLRVGVLRRNRPLYALVGAAVFKWEDQGISPQELQEVASDMDYIDGKAAHRNKSNAAQVTVKEDMLDGWEKVIDRDHFKLWRKPIPNSYLYEYKVFGTYNDLPAKAFFNAQIDTEFRKTWDRLVIKLDVIDRNDETGDEVVQWVMHFPYPMYSREYVYIRNTMVDYSRKLMVIVNRSVEHPSCEVQQQYVRVNTYLSNMVIRPHSSFDENGFDYVLTYYDEPKAAIPSYAYNWMAKTGVPDFVDKVHDAAKKLYEKTHNVDLSEQKTSDKKEQQQAMAM